MRDLRISTTGGDLEAGLDKLVKAGSTLGAVIFQPETEGTSRALEPAARDEILRIVREAMSNAARHGGPSLIKIRAVYRPLSLSVSVTDDVRDFLARSSEMDAMATLAWVACERARGIDGVIGQGTTVGLADRTHAVGMATRRGYFNI